MVKSKLIAFESIKLLKRIFSSDFYRPHRKVYFDDGRILSLTMLQDVQFVKDLLHMRVEITYQITVNDERCFASRLSVNKRF